MTRTALRRRSKRPARNGLRLPSFDLGSLLGRADLLFYLTSVVIVASLLLGGGTRPGFLSDAILQLVTIPFLLYFLWRLFDTPLTGEMRLALLFCAALVALPLFQLIPVPPWLWTSLPNREASAAAFEIAGQPIPWMPISVSPEATWLSALSLIPPLTIFIGTLLLSYRERRWLSLVILAVGIVSVFIGLMQVAQGSESPLRLFEITNESEAVGFFANRNHFAAFIYALILFAGVWTIYVATAAGTRDRSGQYDIPAILGTIGGFTALVILLAGEIMARSRAGLGLTILALFGLLLLGFLYQRDQSALDFRGLFSGFSFNRLLSSFTPAKLLIAVVVLTLTFSLQYGLYRIQDRFGFDPSEDARSIFVPNTIEAAKAYLPFGSGMGTFVSVYPLFEKPEDTLAAYANHAHNDFVEVWLESGILGIILMGIFVSWLAIRSVTVWRKSPPPGASDLDWALVRASTIVVILILVHSFVDYPLRTGGMMAIMAFAGALLFDPLPGAGTRESLEEDSEPRLPRQHTRRKIESLLGGGTATTSSWKH